MRTASAAPGPGQTPGPTPAPGPRRASVVLNGDLLWHNTLVFGAREDAARAGRRGADDLDFEPLLAGVRPVVQAADLAVCHNEVPLAPRGGPYTYYPSFAAPPQTLTAVRAVGYGLCTTASNHSLDAGWPGLVRTLDAMDAAGLKHSGTARTQQEADHPPVFTTAAGVRIAVVTGTYGTNDVPRPAGKPWSVPGLDIDQLLARARTARADGAEIVLVAMHAGEEYQHQPNDQQRRLAERLTASPDVDLVYGHHVHVVQPWTRVNGKWVVYGLGNLVAQHSAERPAGYEGVTARFSFEETEPGRFKVVRAEYLPTLVSRYAPGHPARLSLVNADLREGRGDRARLQQAERRTRAVVTSLGGVEGLVES
ncbi:CapA family protein [Enemella dayhoffiae]|uniref:CapA family protein n=1 Tax=Enemella dayhoffiae TaxID=2016507 RepID=UPI0011401892|nr:CapA family protein [Enemella dayhoffiae]